MLVTTPLVPDEPLASDELALDELLAVRLVLLLPEYELPLLALRDEVDDEDGLLLFVGLGLGTAVTVKEPALMPVPSAFVTATGPLLAPVGTLAVTCVSLFTMKVALRPLNVTACAPVKPLPIRVTLLCTGPEVGIRAVMAGADVGDGVGVGDAASFAMTVRSNVIGSAITALTVVIAPRVLDALVVEAEPSPFEPLDELPVPLSEIVMAASASLSVKSACTVSEMVPVAAVEVR
jgi:hypothetical protein